MCKVLCHDNYCGIESLNFFIVITFAHEILAVDGV